MQRWFFKIFYFALAVISIVALHKIFAGQVYTRGPWTVADNKNASTINSTSWPFEMRLRMKNYVCTTPSPNFDLTEEELIAAWYLPPKTRLSNRMRQIARCHLAAERISSDFDPSKCDCVGWWPIGLVVPLFLNACFYSVRFVFGLPIDKNQDKLYFVSNIPYVFWGVAFMVGIEIDFGIFYTSYGQMYPSGYFGQSTDWKLVMTMIKVGLFASLTEVYFYATGAHRIFIFVADKFQSWFVPKVKTTISCKHSEDEKKNDDIELVVIV